MANRQPTASPKAPRMYSIYRMSDAQPDWAQDDPSQPDYIKNKELVERFRPIEINGEEILDDTYESGALNLVGGSNVTLKVSGNTVTISARSSGGGEGGGCDCPELIEGEGIDITENPEGQQVISIEGGSISDEMIDYISIEKIVQKEGTTIILNGGKANDN